jgi:hypothetical protein
MQASLFTVKSIDLHTSAPFSWIKLKDYENSEVNAFVDEKDVLAIAEQLEQVARELRKPLPAVIDDSWDRGEPHDARACTERAP